MLLTTTNDLIYELEESILQDIPLTRSMGLSIKEYNQKGLYVKAPFAPNVNHACSVFGGSLAAATTMAGWGMVWLILKEHDRTGTVVIQESKISYLRPVTSDFVAFCHHPSAKAVQTMLSMLDRKGKARIDLRCEILQQGHPCVGFHGRYVVLK